MLVPNMPEHPTTTNASMAQEAASQGHTNLEQLMAVFGGHCHIVCGGIILTLYVGGMLPPTLWKCSHNVERPHLGVSHIDVGHTHGRVLEQLLSKARIENNNTL